MKHLISIIIFLLSVCYSFGQLNTSEKNVRQAILGAERIIESILGTDLYRRHIKLDTIDSREVSFPAYSKNFMQPQRLGIDTSFILYFNVTKGKDTLGFLNIYVDKTGKLIENYSDPLSFSTPELIVGYKKLLTNGFKIDLNKAIEIGKQKGFTSTPFLKAESGYKYTLVNNNIYMKVNYYWSFSEFTMGSGKSATLDINVESGEIVKEEYTPGMPK